MKACDLFFHTFLGWCIMQELQDRVAEAKDSTEELMTVGREIVDFHGEMVLLENYSALNYTGSHLYVLKRLTFLLSKCT